MCRKEVAETGLHKVGVELWCAWDATNTGDAPHAAQFGQHTKHQKYEERSHRKSVFNGSMQKDHNSHVRHH